MLYHRLKQEILRLRDSGFVLIRLAELKQRMEVTLRGEDFELAELEAVVGLLPGPGMIQRLDFGGFILPRPEVLSAWSPGPGLRRPTARSILPAFVRRNAVQ